LRFALGGCRGGPLLRVVDDAKWLDQAPAVTLAFVAARLLAEPSAGAELRLTDVATLLAEAIEPG